LAKVMTGERLNFIVASCAILISAASFYATILQANSAEQQVKAMTWPLIEFSHGNYDGESQERILTFSLNNAGVGPAIIKTVKFKYNGELYSDVKEFIRGCCSDVFKNHMEKVKSATKRTDSWSLTTSPTSGRIMAVGGEISIMSLRFEEQNKALWNEINRERWNLQIEICYCSLLETCYVTDMPGSIEEVKACSM